jgi:hypothetical protein
VVKDFFTAKALRAQSFTKIRRKMKKIILILIVSIVLISCSKKEVPFEAFSAEAFVFDIGDGIAEVNSIIRVKGFVQTEKDNNYKAAVGYEIDLLKPDSTITKSIFKFVQKDENIEPISDIALEAQFNLDSTTYKAGVYTLIYKISDENSENTLETKVNFDLEW